MKAAIFDMDGLIVDSEPLWRRAERYVFSSVGVHLTDQMCMETIGYRTDEVIEYWYKKNPWTIKSLETVAEELLQSVTELVRNEGQALDGVYHTLEYLKKNGFKLGLASSSPLSLIDAVIDKLKIRGFFSALSSAADEERGKPHPAVYITTIRRLKVQTDDCIAFEDSIAGVQSAKAAGLRVIAVPASAQYSDQRFDLADLKIRSLKDFSLAMIKEKKTG
jgi:sugar-phosphatase